MADPTTPDPASTVGFGPAGSDPAGFDPARSALVAAAEQVRQAREAAAIAAEQARRLRAQQAYLQQTHDPSDPDRVAALSAVAAEADTAHAEASQARDAAAAATTQQQAALSRFGRASDPRQDVARWTDSIPVLLAPLRIETRFFGDQLWVRVYPDEWAVEAFEPRLTDSQVAVAARWLTGVWQAGGRRDGRLTAWRGLVGSVGSGRAAWIAESYRAVNATDEPADVSADTLVLVVASPDPPTPTELGSISAYWTAIWRAGDDKAKLDAATQALTDDLGPDRAAQVATNPPAGLDASPPTGHTRLTTPVLVTFLQLPTDVDTKPTSWTRPPLTNLLPDRLVLLGYVGSAAVVEQIGAPIPPSLAVGPDPSAAPGDQLRLDGDKLVVPPDLAWLVDFDEAVSVGMGFRVRLDDRTRHGFDRLIVLGLRLRSEPDAAGDELAALLRHHHLSTPGLSLVAQGTPTNNTEAAPSGLSRTDDPDASFHDVFEQAYSPAGYDDWPAKRDGQWLAECLGLDPAVFAGVSHADGTDQMEARAANIALWPATWGYFLHTMVSPILDDHTIETTRMFFTHHVSGRGMVPAIRIGRQPYGILPTTAFTRMTWHSETEARRRDPMAAYLTRLRHVIDTIAADWSALAGPLPHVGALGDPHALLLAIIGLHPNSAELHQRYAQGLEDLYNRLNLGGGIEAILDLFRAMGIDMAVRATLSRIGYAEPPADLEITRRLFFGHQNKLSGPLVDDRPLSESDPVRAYTKDGHNYLHWLADVGATSLETLRTQSGFAAGTAPTALLYLLLRHALLLSWWDSSLRLRLEAGVLDAPALLAARREAPFVHVVEAAPPVAESRWHALYSPAPTVTGSATQLVGEYIPTVLGSLAQVSALAAQVEAVGLLKDVPTARLERVLVEHLDCATYRLDAWRLGLVHQRLVAMRAPRQDTAAQRGIHLGAYGWLEEVRPENKALAPVRLPADLETIFTPADSPPGTRPLMHDPANGGFIHAPSLNHATSAAVLRSGYLATAGKDNPDTMAVNLSSNRVRTALAILEGIRGGQSLSALLGYQFERGLHDRHGLVEVDRFIYPLRKAFPLRADRQSDTATGPHVPIEAIEARSVLDGLELARHVTRKGPGTYPFGLSTLPKATPAEATAINAEVQRLLDANDAVADLALAEGVHQAVLGNFDRVAATLDAYSKIGFPPEPAVVQTPRSGATLTLRVGLHLRPGLDPKTSPIGGLPMTPRAQAEPAVNDWLASVLPDPHDVVCRVTWTDPVSGTPADMVVSQADLGLQPLDLLYAVRTDDRASMTELDDAIIGFAYQSGGLRADAVPVIQYSARVTGKTTIFELSPLIGPLRSLLLRSRALLPSDVRPPTSIDRSVDETVAGHVDRPTLVRAALNTLLGDLASYTSALTPLLGNESALLGGVDSLIEQLAVLLGRATRFGLVTASWGSMMAWRQRTYARVLATVAEAADRLTTSLATANGLINDYDALPPTTKDEERFRPLQQAERLLTTSPTSPRPATPEALRTTVEGFRTTFVGRLAQLTGIPATAPATLSGLLGQVLALPALTDLDPTGLDLAPIRMDVVTYCGQLLARATSAHTEVGARLAKADAALSAHASAVTAADRLSAVVGASRALLGDDALVVGEFTLGATQGDEWQTALSAGAAGAAGTLTDHLTDRDHPVDDWLHGVARVREKMRAFEQVVLFGGLVGRAEPDLVPMQLPHRTGTKWFGLEFPPDQGLDGDWLLYTAHYPVAFDKSAAQCGLLIDEWSEVIAGETETTGIAVSYDRPDCEPPQVMLLVVPPQLTGAWRWDDLVAALHETLDFAKSRAIEPDQLDSSGYGQLTPATVSAATQRPISIYLDLALNNDVARRMPE